MFYGITDRSDCYTGLYSELSMTKGHVETLLLRSRNFL